MNVRTIVWLSLFTTALGACRTGPIARDSDLLPLAPVFGPIVAGEVISGHADGGKGVWMLAGGSHLVYVDLAARQMRRSAIRLRPGELCWGLARLEDGSLWTLKGRHSVVQIDQDGAITRDVALADPHLGIFGAAGGGSFQHGGLSPPAPAPAGGGPPPGEHRTRRRETTAPRAP